MGNWLPDYNPFSGKHWIEGNGWQYTWYVPHDVDGLIHMMGKDLFNTRLEEGFENLLNITLLPMFLTDIRIKLMSIM